MSNISEKEVEILNVISDNNIISQRKISNNVGISLGMVNIFLKKLLEKGLLKIKKTSNKNSLKYILTPQGFSERIRYNMYYLKKNLNYFYNAKEGLIEKLEKLEKVNSDKILIYGIDEWSDLIYLAIQNFNFELIGFLSFEQIELKKRYKKPIYNITELNKITESVVIISNLEQKKDILKYKYNKNFTFEFF